MFAKLEDFYLSILRVAILIVAGLALLAAVGSLLASGAALLPKFGTGTTFTGGKLEDYIGEQKALSSVDAAADGSNEIDEAPRQIDLPSSFLEEATRLYIDYVKRIDKTVVSKKAAEDVVFAQISEIGFEYREDFQNSYLSLLRQLRDSKGKPLTRERFDTLLNWHFDRFQAEVTSASDDGEFSKIEAWDWFTKAGISFLVFIAIASYFLFVRVERHLRLVKVVQIEALPDEETTREAEF